jgi:hypothetical protein
MAVRCIAFSTVDGEAFMLDIVFLTASVTFFIMGALFVRGCDLL